MSNLEETLQPHYASQWAAPSTGPGWDQILLDLHGQLVQMDPNYKIDQIKEKFGTLCYYSSHSKNACGAIKLDGEHDWQNCPFSKLISNAVNLSAETCEECGKPGSMTEHGWIRVLCPEHTPEGSTVYEGGGLFKHIMNKAKKKKACRLGGSPEAS